ncbi:hypothetical protein DC366_01605 [Pelagivirga sediminicola]|uniref:Uncharacterized protein n=1 Tax=Pelagivirga sediminicola TaxID=2170575 RepID=A0A2T7GB97_9RHOB|nr:hypothetical protein [Pelagivirga sediminicola]PVA11683.1 hypothetical protein DC366_01605 [Pelagivirga sediminicola]
MRRPAGILYEDLKIAFVPQIVRLGPSPDDADLTLMQLGEMTIENTGAEPRTLTPGFLEAFDLRVLDTSIQPPQNALPAGGLVLAAGARHAWGLSARTDDDPHDWGGSFSMRHSARRAEVFGDERFHIGHGQFFGSGGSP